MAALLQSEFTNVRDWLNHNRLLLDKKKSCFMLFGTSHKLSHHSAELFVCFNDRIPLEKLGLWIDNISTFQPHIESVVNRINHNLSIFYCSINCFTLQIRKIIATQLLLPIPSKYIIETSAFS